MGLLNNKTRDLYKSRLQQLQRLDKIVEITTLDKYIEGYKNV